jgi:methylmalonyl-CoA/ethylmalonyl-CoA epimerase
MREPLFTETLQIAIVVRDLEETMRTYVEEYGIGPWEIYEFGPNNVTPAADAEAAAGSAWRLAVTMVGSVQWELIEPLDDRSMYAEFLATRGEGLHHVAVGGGAGYRASLDEMRAKGRRVLNGGVYKGATFAYLSTDEDLKVITEIFDWPEGLEQQPDAVYPG